MITEIIKKHWYDFNNVNDNFTIKLFNLKYANRESCMLTITRKQKVINARVEWDVSTGN